MGEKKNTNKAIMLFHTKKRAKTSIAVLYYCSCQTQTYCIYCTWFNIWERLVFSTSGFSHPLKHLCCLERQVIIDHVCVWVCVPVKCQAAWLEGWRSWERAATLRIPERNTPFFVCHLKASQKAPVPVNGLLVSAACSGFQRKLD